MNDRTTESLAYRWVRLGAVCGLVVLVIYPLLIFVSLPDLVAIALVCAFGPLLGIACMGLYHFMAPVRKTVSLQIAVVSNVIAGSFLTMLLHDGLDFYRWILGHRGFSW